MRVSLPKCTGSPVVGHYMGPHVPRKTRPIVAHFSVFVYQHPTSQVSEMVAFGDLKVAGGDLLEGPGIVLLHGHDWYRMHIL